MSDCLHLKHGLMITPDSEVRPCCRFDTGAQGGSFFWDQSNSLVSHMNSDFLKSLRGEDYLAGCHKCYREEESGQKSMRTKASIPNPLAVMDRDSIFLEVSAGRVCNLKCRSCSAKYSTKWDEDSRRLNLSVPDGAIHFDFSRISDQILKKIQVLKVSGGEPLLNPKMLPLLHRILKLRPDGDLQINFYTNGTISPSIELIEALRGFQETNVAISVDDVKEKNSYLRSPLKWSNFEDVTSQWLSIFKESQVNINFATTIGTFNVLSLFDLFKWRSELEWQPEIVFQMIHDPEYMSLFYLPNGAKKKFLEIHRFQLEEIKDEFSLSELDSSRLDRVTKVLCQESESSLSSKEIRESIEELDLLRGQSFEKTFPQVYELLCL